MTKIAAATKRGDLDEISRLTSLAKRASDIRQTCAALDKELNDIENSLRNGHASTAPVSVARPDDCDSDWNTPSSRHKLRVTIDWPALGRHDLGKRTLSDQHPTYILIDFIKELRAAFGDDVLERLSTLRVSRGPLISLNPKADFRNPKQGTLYSHHRCKGSPYYLLTHSSTPEKAKNIREAAKHLGLDTTKVQVDLRE